MTTKNTIKNLPPSIRVATFGLLLMGCLLMINMYLPKYLMENPPVCKEQGVVQEIISLSGNMAQIKLQNQSIIHQPIKNYDSEKQVFNKKIEPGQVVCIKYENFIIYNLYKTLISYG